MTEAVVIGAVAIAVLVASIAVRALWRERAAEKRGDPFVTYYGGQRRKAG